MLRIISSQIFRCSMSNVLLCDQDQFPSLDLNSFRHFSIMPRINVTDQKLCAAQLNSYKNQTIVDLSSSVTSGHTSFFQGILDSFPTDRSLVFAYGSGVFQQEGQMNKSNNMVDLIFVVNDSTTWHKENMDRHPHHYASLTRLLGPNIVTRIQEDYGARFYFNTLVPWKSGLIKYGVISKEHMLEDARNWQTLYLAGRLHKPVNIIEQATDKDIDEALTTNLNSALHTALLLLPAQFTEEELYLSIAGVSYTGDFRMVVGEDKGKVGNIVRPQVDRFRDLYRKRILDVTQDVLYIKDGVCVQDLGPSGRHHHLVRLPRGLSRRLVKDRKVGYTDMEEIMLELSGDQDCCRLVRQCVSDIVSSTDKSQAVKGILTAGPRKAAYYAGAKLAKMIKSVRKTKS